MHFVWCDVDRKNIGCFYSPATTYSTHATILAQTSYLSAHRLYYYPYLLCITYAESFWRNILQHLPFLCIVCVYVPANMKVKLYFTASLQHGLSQQQPTSPTCPTHTPSALKHGHGGGSFCCTQHSSILSSLQLLLHASLSPLPPTLLPPCHSFRPLQHLPFYPLGMTCGMPAHLHLPFCTLPFSHIPSVSVILSCYLSLCVPGHLFGT